MADRQHTVFDRNTLSGRAYAARQTGTAEPSDIALDPGFGGIAAMKPEANAALPILAIEQKPLLHVRSAFPFQLFPDELIIRVNHVDYFRNVFFASATMTRVLIPDIKSVMLHYNPVFATIEIVPMVPFKQQLRIKHLWKGQARKARRILSGLMETHQQGLDFTRYSHRDLVLMLSEIGRARE